MVGAHGHPHRAVVALLQTHGHGETGGDAIGGDDDWGAEVRVGADPAAPVVGAGGVDSADPAVLADVGTQRFDLFEESGPAALRMPGEGFVHAHPGSGQTIVRGAVDVGPVDLEAVAAADEAQSPIAMPALGFGSLETEVPDLLDRARGEGVAADLVARETELLEDDDVMAGLGEVRSERRSGGTGPDDDDVGVELVHGLSAWWTATMPPERFRYFTWSNPASRIWTANASWSGHARIDSAR